jgi:hypothetical protein
MLSLYGKQARILLFQPEKWTQRERFYCFRSMTFKQFSEQTRGALSGVSGHLERARLFFKLVPSMIPAIQTDKTKLLANGYSTNEGAEMLAAVFESVFCELHSCVDCTCYLIAKIYEDEDGIVEFPTSKLFQNAKDNRISSGVPILIRDALKQAKEKWFDELQLLRNTIDHSNVGICDLDKATGIISYRSRGEAKLGKPKPIEDANSRAAFCFDAVNHFVEDVFRALNGELKDEEVVVLCGWFNGPAYQRRIRPSEALDFHSGRCVSFDWFEQQGKQVCPFASECGAYRKIKELRSA